MCCLLTAQQAPSDVEQKIDELLNKCRSSDSMDFSRRKSGGLGIISTNAALNTFCDLGWGTCLASLPLCLPPLSPLRRSTLVLIPTARIIKQSFSAQIVLFALFDWTSGSGEDSHLVRCNVWKGQGAGINGSFDNGR